MRNLILAVGAAALGFATPAAAQDPGSDAIAVANAIWPDGTMAQMMTDSMQPMMDGMMASVEGLPMESIMGMVAAEAEDEAEAEEIRQILSGLTFGEMMTLMDPHYAERQSISMSIMLEEMTPVMIELEPVMKARLASVMARKYDAEELSAARAFFETENGSAFGAKFMSVYMDPEYMAIMTDIMPQIMAVIPAASARTIEATSHLPPPGAGFEERLQALVELHVAKD